MRESPQFSVVVPLYNKRAYIRRAVDSVLAQTLTDFELIVVDDGSTDGSIEVLNDISDARLRIIQQQNQGEGPARNTGMGIARAKWIALLDADDAWLEFHLLELAKIANTFPEPGLISTSCVEGTGMKNPAPATPKSGSTIRKIDYFLEASRQIGFINSTSAAVHRQVFEKIGGFTKAKAGADLEYWARIALNYPVAVSRMVTCTYFRDTSGVMQQISKVQLNHRSKPLLYLREISPSLAMLCGRADFYPDLCRNSSSL